VAKLDLATGAIDTTFSPPVANGTQGAVTSLAISGSSLFIGGPFTQYRSKLHGGLVKVSLANGAPDPIFSPADPPTGFTSAGAVNVILVSGTSIYAGGGPMSFLSPSAATTFRLGGLIKIDVATGEADAAFADTELDVPPISSLAASASALYVGGRFKAYKGVANSANGLAKLDLATGAIDTTFSPAGAGANGVDGEVMALAVSGTSLYIGGGFSAYRGTEAYSFAKVDATSGVLDTAFGPPTAERTSVPVNVLAPNGNVLFMSGDFDRYGSTASVLRAAFVDLQTGALVAPK
jgi:hypothetical protein